MSLHGHNKPPFDPTEIVDLEALAAQLRLTYGYKFDRQKELVTAARNWLFTFVDGSTPAFRDANDAAEATDRLAQIKAEIDACHGKENSIHTVAKAPFLKGGRIVDQVLNAELVDPLRATAESISKPLLAYHKKVKDEEAARLKRESEAAAQEAAAAALKAAREASTDEALEATMQAEQEAMESAQAAQSAPKPSLVRGDYGTSSGLRGKWKPKIVDASKIPVMYMIPNLPLIEAAGKTKGKDGQPVAVIPGVEWEFEETLATRR